MDALKLIAADSLKKDLPSFEIGDTVRVHVNIREGDRERIQMFEGTVIARKGSGVAETFTVRRVSYGVGVERVFPVNSPNVQGVDIVRKGRVRRSKLYYLRDRVGKAAKVKAVSYTHLNSVEEEGSTFIEFTAQTRMSGVDLPNGTKIRKGAAEAIEQYVKEMGGQVPSDLHEEVNKISSLGGTPLRQISM